MSAPKKIKCLDAYTTSGLHELRLALPHGGVGRNINSFIFQDHVDAAEWQRQFWIDLIAGYLRVGKTVVKRITPAVAEVVQARLQSQP